MSDDYYYYSPPAPPPTPVSWNSKTDDKTPGATHNNPNGAGPAAPPVPGVTSVNTTALANFSTYIGELIPPIKALVQELTGVDVQPGAFYDADQIRTVINGLNDDAGLKSSYTKIIGDLVQGLTDIQTALGQMATKYTTTDELNKATVTDLQNDFQTVQSDFTSMMSDAAQPAPSTG